MLARMEGRGDQSGRPQMKNREGQAIQCRMRCVDWQAQTTAASSPHLRGQLTLQFSNGIDCEVFAGEVLEGSACGGRDPSDRSGRLEGTTYGCMILFNSIGFLGRYNGYVHGQERERSEW